MTVDDVHQALLERFVTAAAGQNRFELEEPNVLALLEGIAGSREEAQEAWDAISGQMRNRSVHRDYITQWDMFRRVMKLSKLPKIEELESACELYQAFTPREIERRIQGLSGTEFEVFLTSLLARLPQFREIRTTRQSHDDGVDFKGIFVPGSDAPHFTLIGQAKRLTSAVTAPQARDFIGALNISGERWLLGLFVCTGGFTQPALDTFDKCSVRIMRWDLAELMRRAAELTTRRVELSFGVPDDTFWDEVFDRA